jgi:hypothetical protein
MDSLAKEVANVFGDSVSDKSVDPASVSGVDYSPAEGRCKYRQVAPSEVEDDVHDETARCCTHVRR